MSLHHRRAHSSRGVEGRINACRQRLRLNRAAQRMRDAHQDVMPDEGQDVMPREEVAASAELPDALRMSSVAEILSGAVRELAWLESESAPEVDQRTPGRTGLSLKEEVGTA